MSQDRCDHMELTLGPRKCDINQQGEFRSVSCMGCGTWIDIDLTALTVKFGKDLNSPPCIEHIKGLLAENGTAPRGRLIQGPW